MGLEDWFKPLSTWSAEEVRRFLAAHEAADYYLIDVREPVEFESGHLPGARSFPLSGLSASAETLDPWRQTVVYCENGLRSRGAAALLGRAGFLNVHVLGGGLAAWEGARTRVMTEGQAPVLSLSQDAWDAVHLAMQMENGSRRFYVEAAAAIQHPYLQWAFQELAEDEKHHEQALLALDQELRKGHPRSRRRKGLPDLDLIEGGMRLSEILPQVREMAPREVAELAMALEANACDLHLRLERRETDSRTRKVFHQLAESERQHLERVTRLLSGDMGADL